MEENAPGHVDDCEGHPWPCTCLCLRVSTLVQPSEVTAMAYSLYDAVTLQVFVRLPEAAPHKGVGYMPLTVASVTKDER